MTEMNRTNAWQETSARSVLTTFSDIWNSILFRAKEYTKEAVEHLILAVVLYCILCVLLYAGIVHWNVLEFRRDVKSPKRVLLVVAHPDDECMFFGPTVLNFTRQRNCTLYIMCLSTGRNYGKGKVRKDEFYESCKVLGIDEGCVFVHNHTALPDCMKTKWPIEIVSNLILHHVEVYEIDTLITFDRQGVSKHLNHTSIYYAIAQLVLEKRLPQECKMYVLETVNVFRKYWLFFDIPLCYLLSSTRYILNWSDRALVHSAMKRHASQYVWFRRLYITFSRYMLINTLQEMNISDLELELELDD